jgi:hypothetical protein
MALQWRVERRDPRGLNPVTIDEGGAITALESFTVKGNGDCGEAKFLGLAARLPISHGDIITLQTNRDGAGWVNRYAGVIVDCGNPRSTTPTRYRAKGLRKLCERAVMFNDSLSTGDIGSVAKTAASTVLTSGQLGPCTSSGGVSVISDTYTAAIIAERALFPDQAFIVPATYPNGNNLATYLDELVKTVPGLSWGVNADRKLFFGAIGGSQAIDLRTRGVDATWRESTSEDLCNAVLWVGPRTSNKGRVREQQTNPEVFLKHFSAGDGAHGWAVKSLSVPPEYGNGMLVPLTEGVTFTLEAGSIMSGTLGTLSDGSNQTFVTFLPSVTYPSLAITMHIPAGVKCDGFYLDMLTADPVLWAATDEGGLVPPSDDYAIIDGTYVPAIVALGTETVGRELTVAFNPAWSFIRGGDSQQVKIAELYPVRLNTELLDSIAEGYFRYPALDPATITARRMIDPAPEVTITLPDGSTIARPAEAFTYVFTRGEFGLTRVDVGQQFDADEQARAALIKAKSEAAQLRAVQTSGVSV